ncbi:bifunctional protein tyrosine phosphatase family protein/NAD(P)/FAD-dependent oxidoreductase [Massilia sp. 9096]|uniref:bifunctional protein tyrosine phosphatase family protein/NAD(P)/FAD-dependent oxidoreductase n=1 Tax=Massilia sp. 9096 TaxID=1500894 RepID=UPI00056484A3|nr:bifunctional protein tyrosine phosphatase family protein/NAD(P)/FAD-dependent oxidoreductase [Massilia sp. 9096]
MRITHLTGKFSVSPQIHPADVAAIAAAGYDAIICNRPDGEAADQPDYRDIQASALTAGIRTFYLPVEPNGLNDQLVTAFGSLLDDLHGPVLAYCRSGKRSASLWALTCGQAMPPQEILARAARAGHDLATLLPRIAAPGPWREALISSSHQVLISGAGAAGIAVAASLLARDAALDIAIVDPADTHYYQPGWTMVGAGVFHPAQTMRPMDTVIPAGVRRIKAKVVCFDPDHNAVVLDNGQFVGYDQLVVCPGLTLDWDAVDGLRAALGSNGVTSNYDYKLAPYTAELVERFQGGTALFTQPPMPIKCAGAPQKAMYLSCDAWRRRSVLGKADVQFHSAGAVLFGVADYVPALMEYVRAYGIDLRFGRRLVAVDGASRSATFAVATPDGERHDEVRFDMLHAVPPQRAPDFIRASPLADSAGWLDVDPATLHSKRYPNVFGLGDVINAPNAKTAAAARKQAPVVAHNLLANLGRHARAAHYDGYGSCPLTVERGRIVLAEFRYGGKLAPSFPRWLLDGRKPSRLAWLLKERILPPLYWHGMLKGREWMASPAIDA